MSGFPAARMLGAATACLLLASLPAVAQPGPANEASGAPPARTVVAVPLQDLPEGGTLAERASELWSDLLAKLGFRGYGHYMRQHRAVLADRAEIRDEFTGLMDLVGYKLKEIDSSIGLIPSFSLTFGQARELTEADREYVERQLERHAMRNPGPISVVHRAVLRGILDATEMGGFNVDKVEVTLLPLPKIKFALGPVDAPLGIEASRIMRSIEQLSNKLRPGPLQGHGAVPPSLPEAPLLRPAGLVH